MSSLRLYIEKLSFSFWCNQMVKEQQLFCRFTMRFASYCTDCFLFWLILQNMYLPKNLRLQNIDAQKRALCCQEVKIFQTGTQRVVPSLGLPSLNVWEESEGWLLHGWAGSGQVYGTDDRHCANWCKRTCGAKFGKEPPLTVPIASVLIHDSMFWYGFHAFFSTYKVLPSLHLTHSYYPPPNSLSNIPSPGNASHHSPPSVLLDTQT